MPCVARWPSSKNDVTPLILGTLALMLAGPVPALLARVPRLRRTPASAVVLWQSVSLAAILAALGAGVSLGTDRAWRGSGAGEPGPSSYAVAVAALVITALVVARLLLSGHRVGKEMRTIRAAHLARVDLVAQRTIGGVRVLDHPVPIAYCLPGMHQSRMVMSSGALARLPQDQLGAIVEHERAHLRARHDLVLEAFTVLARAFPRVVSSRAALAEVSLLIEILADRAAARSHGPVALGRALLSMAEARAPRGALGVGETGLTARVHLLAQTGTHRVQGAAVVTGCVAVLLVPTVFVVLPWWHGLLG